MLQLILHLIWSVLSGAWPCCGPYLHPLLRNKRVCQCNYIILKSSKLQIYLGFEGYIQDILAMWILEEMWYEIFVLLDLDRTFSTRCEGRSRRWLNLGQMAAEEVWGGNFANNMKGRILEIFECNRHNSLF